MTSEKKSLKDRRRQHIIKSLYQSENFSGFDEFKMDDIAAEAGLTKPTIYRYFPSKDDLFYAYAAYGYNEVTKLIEKKLNLIQPDSIVNALQTLSTSYYSFSQDHPSLIKVLNSLGEKNSFLRLSDKKKKDPNDLTESEIEYVDAYMDFRILIDENVSNLNLDSLQNLYPNMEKSDFTEIISIVINGIITEFQQRSQTLQRKGISEKFVLELVMALIGKGME